jgi:hypothetical protein
MAIANKQVFDFNIIEGYAVTYQLLSYYTYTCHLQKNTQKVTIAIANKQVFDFNFIAGHTVTYHLFLSYYT